jgi:thiazole/oxazole-forming peptide maturase SagD family component
MKLVIGAHDAPLTPATELLLQRLSGPFSGISPHIFFTLRSDLEPRVAVANTGLESAAHAVHIAGIGASSEEATIAVLAESIERYAPRTWLASHPQRILRASFRSMEANGQVFLRDDLRYFSESQLARPGFPFTVINSETVVSWVATKSLLSGSTGWLPARIALGGDIRWPDEPNFALGVTTGTAAHRTTPSALRNALLELIQIDAAMGRWYGAQSSYLVRHDTRTLPVVQLVRRQLRPHMAAPRFYWLPSMDLPSLPIACVIESPEIARFVVGLGCDLRLGRSLYKAFLEAVAVGQLAKLNVLLQAVRGPTRDLDPFRLYDFDSNVAYYAMEERREFRAAFDGAKSVTASELPPDVDLGPIGDVCHLTAAFKETGKELAFLDLTTPDIADLGFRVARVWSPDTLSLSLPSAAPVLHPRFRAYGGVIRESPHPYP